MKIGIVTHAYYPHFGGVTEHVSGCAAALRDRDHRVVVITANARHAEDGPCVHRIGTQRLLSIHGASVNVTLGLRLRSRLRALFSELELDVVHVHCPLTPMLPLAATRAASDRGLPLVGTFHAAARRSVGYQLFRRPLARDFQRLDRRIAVSVPARDFLERYFDGPLDIIPNGIDLNRFPPSKLPDGPPTIVYVGRLDPRKGVEHVIDALDPIRQRVPDVRLLVVGEGPRRAFLKRRAARRAPGRVEFVGAAPPAALPSYYRRAHVVCAPATCNESFGIVLLEAMASGRPAVASDISGYRRLLQDGITGILVSPADVAGWAQALAELLVDPERAALMGDAARRQAERYGWGAIAARLERMYRELAGHAAPIPDDAGLVAQPA